MTRSRAGVALKGSARRPARGAVPVGEVAGDEQCDISVLLRRRTADTALRRAITVGQFSIGGSGRRPTRAEFEEQFGASPEDVAKLRAFAAQHGIEVVDSNQAARTVHLSGALGDVASAFGADIGLYATEHGSYRGRRGSLHLPADVAAIVEGVFGIDTRRQAYPHIRTVQHPEPDKVRTVRDIASLYNYPGDLDGSGQCVGLIELGGGYAATDMTSYFQALGVALPTLTDVSVDGGANNFSSDPASRFDNEVALDLQVAGGAAPGAKYVLYFAPNTSRGFLDAVATAIHDDLHAPSVISISWGSAEVRWTQQAQRAFDGLFVDAAALGVTVLCSSGDLGSAAGQQDDRAHVELPASSPHVLACGGTTLVIDNEQIVDEVVWSDDAGKSGGGVSDVFNLPPWQRSARVPRSHNPRHRTGRGVPDIAANADSDVAYRILSHGVWQAGAGTSAVAPLLAALVALTNQRMGTSAGFLNPVLYRNPDFASVFRDVVAGNNGAYRADRGWDACTGLGRPSGEEWIATCTGLNDRGGGRAR